MSLKNQKMTIKQIAANLNLSAPTVSIILNGNPKGRYIAKATSKRVLDYVKEIGFHQDIGALAMRGKYSKEVVIVARRRLTREQRQVYFRLIEHLEKLKISHITTFFDDDGFPQLVKEVEFFNPEKIVVFPGLSYKPNFEQWTEIRKNFLSNIPCLFFDMDKDNRVIVNKDDVTLTMNRQDCWREIAQSLSSKKFTTVFMPSNYMVEQYLKNKSLKILKLEKAETLYMSEPENNFYLKGLVEAGKHYAKRIFETPFNKGETAAYLGDDLVCCSAIKYLQQHSIKVPGDLEMFSFGYMPESEIFPYTFTTWAPPYEAMYQEMIKWITGDKSFDKNKVFGIKKIIHK